MNDTEKHIEAAMVLAARIVARHGEVYLPIFERLENELANAQSVTTCLARAIHLSRDISD